MGNSCKPQQKSNSYSFDISIPGKRTINTILYILLALIISSIIVLFATKKFNLISFFSIIILTILLCIIFFTMGNNVLSISLPFTTYPTTPHLNLDAVSLPNVFAGRQI